MYIFEVGVGAGLVSKFVWMWPEWTRAGMIEDFGDHFTATLYQGYFTYKDNKNRIQQDFCMCMVSVSLISLFYPHNCIPIQLQGELHNSDSNGARIFCLFYKIQFPECQDLEGFSMQHASCAKISVEFEFSILKSPHDTATSILKGSYC